MLSPLPVVMVSCGGNMLPREGGEPVDSGYKPNVVTVAWCGIVCTQPPMVYISLRPSRHSYEIIEKTDEFTINLVTSETVRAADSCGVYSGRHTDKLERFSLATEPSASGSVGCPSLAASPLTLDCRVTQKIPLGSHDMFLARVCGVGVEPELVDSEGKLHLERARLAAYSHGNYFELGRQIGSFGFSVKKKSRGGQKNVAPNGKNAKYAKKKKPDQK